jgi:hypothetical protein
MKDKDYSQIIELVYMGGGYIPNNTKAKEFTEQLTKGEVISFLEVTKRDLKFHRCYMSLLASIWEYLPENFKKKVPKSIFYNWLKHLQGHYKVKYEFIDGSKYLEYDSIAFGSMSDKRFKEYVKDQLPFIYSNVIGAFYKDVLYENIVEEIESNYEKFMQRL